MLSKKRKAFCKVLEKEELHGGEHGKSPVVHHRHSHDPGIQQEPCGKLHALSGALRRVRRTGESDGRRDDRGTQSVRTRVPTPSVGTRHIRARASFAQRSLLQRNDLTMDNPSEQPLREPVGMLIIAFGALATVMSPILIGLMHRSGGQLSVVSCLVVPSHRFTISIAQSG